MTEPRSTDSFETALARRIRAHTDRATERRIDALEIAQAAMTSARAGGWARRTAGFGPVGRPRAGLGWAAALVAVAVTGAFGIAVLSRPSDALGPQPTRSPSPAASGPVPETLRHAWQRPAPVLPGLDSFGSGFLRLESGQLRFGPTAGDVATGDAVAVAGTDTLITTATSETHGCAIGDAGTYRWSVAGQGTVLVLTAIGADACAAREPALAGSWVRADLPGPPSDEPLPPGTYRTSAFDAFGATGVTGQLSYAVPDRWKVKEDLAGAFLLHRLGDDSAAPPSPDTFIHLFTQARLMADYGEGAICGESSEASGVGRTVEGIVTAIRARPGVVSTRPAAVTIGGYAGQMLDLRLDATWTGGCQHPTGRIIAMPLLLGIESEPSAGIGLVLDGPVRLILLDLGAGRTMAVAIFGGEPMPAAFQQQIADAMPVIESFAFHPPRP
jgi:hypothetical protein